MNRIVLIGNGFDLAHGLKTSYRDFIYDYWEQTVKAFFKDYPGFTQDPLFEQIHFLHSLNDKSVHELKQFNLRNRTGAEILAKLSSTGDFMRDVTSVLMYHICKDIHNKNWVDIEEDYYKLLRYHAFKSCGRKPVDIFDTQDKCYINPAELNNQLNFLKEVLADYLTRVSHNIKVDSRIKDIITSYFKKEEIAVESLGLFEDYRKEISERDPREVEYQFKSLGLNSTFVISNFSRYKADLKDAKEYHTKAPEFSEYMLRPQHILLLNFNYTKVANLYLNEKYNSISLNHIHGSLNDHENMIFGYGDELDENYEIIKGLNDNSYLRNIKSILYLQNNNYKELLRLMDSAPFQIYIMGHSCGNSDRTLLNTMFEHKNCVSIKPYYYEHDGKDNYMDIVQNISRNFTDMRLMRDRVVNKSLCEPLPQRNG